MVKSFLAPVTLACFLLLTASATKADTVGFVDFTRLPSGQPFNANTFLSTGVTFTAGDFIGFIQGNSALVSSYQNSTTHKVQGSFTSSVSSLEVTFFPAIQGTAIFTLFLYDSGSHLLGSSSQTLFTGPLGGGGVLRVSLDPSAGGAASFLLTSSLVSNSGNSVGPIEFGVTTLLFTSIPEPGTLMLLGGGLALILSFRRRQMR